MPTTRHESDRPSGWGRYLELLVRERVPANARRWYMQRAEDFVAAVRPKRLSEVTAAAITAFFPRYARGHQFTDRQFRQTVDALQPLLVDLVRSTGAPEVDWEYPRESGRALEATHPTRAAAMSPEAAAGSSVGNGAGSARVSMPGRQMVRSRHQRSYWPSRGRTLSAKGHRFIGHPAQ